METTGASSDPLVKHGPAVLAMRIFAWGLVAVALTFVLNNYLIFWRGWPGLFNLFGHLGWFGLAPPRTPLDGTALTLGWLQVGFYLASIFGAVGYVLATRERTLHVDADALTALANFIVRAAYWGVLLVGIADSFLSFLRVEGLLADVFGAQLAEDLGRSAFRGLYVHYPLLGAGLVIAFFTRSLVFAWLALLIVVAEVQIVIARFVFSYEQAFMADLVRFWYGALFLFSSAHTLIAEGHVRVDILYTNFSERGKAWSNVFGCLLLGIPLCWVVLTRGMWESTTVINGPLLSFEVTQSGYGLYVKYLLAAFLLVYALSMLVQFCGYLLKNGAVLLHERGVHAPPSEHAEI